jgi:hypothetical protein
MQLPLPQLVANEIWQEIL